MSVSGTAHRVPGERGEATRRKILVAAEDVFAHYSYHDASIVKITEAAQVAQGTFYLYFHSKQEVFEELVADLSTRLRCSMRQASVGAPSRLEAERRGFQAFFRFTTKHPALYRVIRQAEFVSPQAMRRHYDRIVDGYARALSDAMAEGEIALADPAVVAWCLMGVGELVGMRWILWGPRQQLPAAVAREVEAFVQRALCPAEPVA